MCSPSPIVVPSWLPPSVKYRQVTRQGDTSQLPVNVNAADWPTTRLGGEIVKSEVGAADAGAADHQPAPISRKRTTTPQNRVLTRFMTLFSVPGAGGHPCSRVRV